MSQQKSNILNNLSRRKTLQIISAIGAGFVITFVAKRLFQKQELVDEVVTVDASGNIINRQPLNANYFTEDLGNGVTLEMAEIPGGEFLMGSPPNEKGRHQNESPQHKVTIKPFFIGKFAITGAQYKEIMGKGPYIFNGEKHPVEIPTWNDATEFCKKLTEKTGRTYRLPSEAEWEYACRAGTNTPFHFGETITTDLANFDGNRTYADAQKGEYRRHTIEVGSFPPNAFGLYDMHGNIFEWCEDTYHDNYNSAPSDGRAWIDNNNRSRTVRGGSWKSSPVGCRSACRQPYHSLIFIYFGIGLRVVCDSAPKILTIDY